MPITVSKNTTKVSSEDIEEFFTAIVDPDYASTRNIIVEVRHHDSYHGDFGVSCWYECYDHIFNLSFARLSKLTKSPLEKLAAVANKDSIPVIPVNYLRGIIDDLSAYDRRNFLRCDLDSLTLSPLRITGVDKARRLKERIEEAEKAIYNKEYKLCQYHCQIQDIKERTKRVNKSLEKLEAKKAKLIAKLEKET